MAEYVMSVEQIGPTLLPLVGGKAANLGELSRLPGVNVPDGFCVTTDAYADIVARDDHLHRLLEGLAGVAGGDLEGIRSVSARIRDAIEALSIPAGISGAIAGQLHRLGDTEAYAVRSSATAEDLPTASFAGQQDTYLNVIGLDAVLRCVRNCWASLFTERAVAYRLQQGIDHRGVQLAVVIQRMVFADVAGIMFTADPITSDRRTVSIDAGFGLGEALVSGLANADNYRVRDENIVGRLVSAQTVAVRPLPGGGTEQTGVDADRQTARKLTDAQILRLAGIGRELEAHFGGPQDVEWALADDEFSIVQSRPITTLFPVPGPQDGKNHVYMSFGHQQMMTDAMKPLGMSFFQAQFEGTPLIEAGGRLFIDMAPDLASPVGRQLALASLRAIDPLIDSAIRILMKRKGFAKNLAGDGERYLTLGGGGGYFTWRLPVEAVKLYRSNDPAPIAALKADHEADLDEQQRKLGSLSGDELFEAVLDDLRQHLKVEVIDPRSMGAVYAGMFALNRVNKRMEKWLAVKGAADVLAQAVADDVTSQMGLALLDVADIVRRHPQAMAVLPLLTDDTFFADLSAVEGGESVSQAIRAFLDSYGMRCPGEIDLTRPRWSEAPTQLVPMILSNANSIEEDPAPSARAGRVERSRRRADEMQQSLVDRLQREPGGRWKARRAAKMISRVRTFAGYREYPKYLMMRHYWMIKRALLAEAARLVDAGIVRRPDDVYYLTFDEFREAARTGRVDQELIGQRRAEFERDTRLTPPRVITSDGEVPPGAYENATAPDGALTGIAASAGTVEGRARLVLDLADAYLEEGDILVTTYTDPSWTPVFLTVRGLVTEVGGMMTHGAVVAREYGLPAVVGVDGATRLLRDGQRIRVNGTDGYVELL
nr:rifamycin-inactivating phosphotransferase [Propionicimonas sp.]